MEQQRDHGELIQLIQENQKIIYKICNSYCSNESDREDLGQEIVYQLIKSYHGFKPEYKFSTWMYRVALNVAISFYRKSKGGQVIQLVDAHREQGDHHGETPDVEHNLYILRQFINELRELDKALMLLHLETKSYREIADILGISETNVGTKINRIKDKLKQKFQKLNQQ